MKVSPSIKKIFHTFIFAYVFLMIALTVPTNFSVTAPNETRIANTMIQMNGYEQSSHFKTISVLTMSRITPFARMLYLMLEEFDISLMGVYESQLTKGEERLRSNIQKQASFEQSLITAYELAKLKNPTVSIDYEWVGMIVDYREAKHQNLNIGDIILDVNEQDFSDYETMGNYFLEQDSTVVIEVLRNQETLSITLDKSSLDVFRFYPKYNIVSSNPTFELPGQSVFSGGPSAGMMYTLSIYFALVDDLTIDVDIVGTGTIRYNQEVGNIGGLRQKAYGAIKEGIKHFIIPYNQYGEIGDLSDRIHIYPVKNILEAIEVVYEISN